MNPYEPILNELSTAMLDTAEIKPNYSNDALLDATIIFQTVLIDKVFDLMKKENIENKTAMVEACGKELRKLILTYTGLDTVELTEEYGIN